MADLYVWHAAGTSGTPYATWGTAAATLTIAAAAAAAGDTIYVASDHAESSGSAIAIAFTNGVVTNPIKVICGVKTGTGAETGISALATTASVTCTTTALSITTGSAYIYGVIFKITSTSVSIMRISYAAEDANNHKTFEQCTFIHDGNGATSSIRTGHDRNVIQNHTILKNCQFEFSHSGQYFAAEGLTEIIGGSLTASSSSQTYFGRSSVTGRGGLLYIRGFDASNGGTGMALFGLGGTTNYNEARNCKLPTSGVMLSGTSSGIHRTLMVNCDAGDTNYKYSYADAYGTVADDTTVYRTAGAADEARGYSLKMTSTTSVVWPAFSLVSPPIMQRQASSGTDVNVLVHICHDGASALTDQECWLEVEYLGTSGFPLALIARDTVTAIESPSAQPVSGEAWTGDSGTGPNGSSTWNQLKLECPQLTLAETGYVIARVHLAKASTTVYIDPKLEITPVA